MCSIYGAIGRHIGSELEVIRREARDRGRDGGRLESYPLQDGKLTAVLGNWRATPTPELEVGPLQPYNRLVHNGTIANDQELGALPGEIDSQVLARVLDRTDVVSFAQSLAQVKGSYALACVNDKTILVAANYKPLYYVDINGVIYFSSMARHFAGVLEFGRGPVAVPPYHALDLMTGDFACLPMGSDGEKRAVVIASAGLDSTVAATRLVRDGYDVCLLHFSYGCVAESNELSCIRAIAASLDCHYEVLDVDLAHILGMRSSPLFCTDDTIAGAIAGAEYAHEWVPGRNLVFISLAVAWAEANGYHVVALGNNLEEAGAYPDNEEEFTHLLDKAVPYAVQAHYGMRVLSPVGNLMKHEIVKAGLLLAAPLHLTWSCYRGGKTHCGNCGPCFMRRKAFERCGAKDPVFETTQS